MGIWHKKRNKKIIKEFKERYESEFKTGKKLCKQIRLELAEKYKVSLDLVSHLVYNSEDKNENKNKRN